MILSKIKLNEIVKIKCKRKTILGRGSSSGKGKTCSKGNKGQKSKSKSKFYFEGGQTNFYKIITKKGFYTKKKIYNLNIIILEKYYYTLINYNLLKKFLKINFININVFYLFNFNFFFIFCKI